MPVYTVITARIRGIKGGRYPIALALSENEVKRHVSSIFSSSGYYLKMSVI